MLTSLRLSPITREAYTKGFVFWNCELETVGLSTLHFPAPLLKTSLHVQLHQLRCCSWRGPHLYLPLPEGRSLQWLHEGGVLGTGDVFAIWFTNCCYVPCWGSCSVQALINWGWGRAGDPVACFLHFSLSVVLPHCLIPLLQFDPCEVSPYLLLAGTSLLTTNDIIHNSYPYSYLGVICLFISS